MAFWDDVAELFSSAAETIREWIEEAAEAAREWVAEALDRLADVVASAAEALDRAALEMQAAALEARGGGELADLVREALEAGDRDAARALLEASWELLGEAADEVREVMEEVGEGEDELEEVLERLGEAAEELEEAMEALEEWREQLEEWGVDWDELTEEEQEFLMEHLGGGEGGEVRAVFWTLQEAIAYAMQFPAHLRRLVFIFRLDDGTWAVVEADS